MGIDTAKGHAILLCIVPKTLTVGEEFLVIGHHLLREHEGQEEVVEDEDEEEEESEVMKRSRKSERTAQLMHATWR